MKNKKILFIVNNASVFVSHRLNLLQKASAEGLKTYVIFGHNKNYDVENIAYKKLSKLKINYRKLRFRSSNINPFKEIYYLIELFFTIRSIKPNIIHVVSLKPIILCGLISLLYKKIFTIFAVSGLGYMFTDIKKKERKILQSIFNFFFKIILLKKNKIIVVQNNDDKKYLLNKFNKINNNNIYCIPGCGINIEKFKPIEYEKKEKIVLFPGRLLHDKGVKEFLEASLFLKSKFKDWHFIIAGSAESDNPSSISKTLLYKYILNNSIEWIGHVDNMPKLFQKVQIVCLPSYREGMPRALQEAASCECSIITTDTIGCKDSIINNKTGLLVKMKSKDSLITGIRTLILDKNLRKKFAKNGRKYVIKNFAEKIILNKFMNIYEKFIDYESLLFNKKFINVIIKNNKFELNRLNINNIYNKLNTKKTNVLIIGSSSYVGQNLLEYLFNYNDVNVLGLERNSEIKLSDLDKMLLWKKNISIISDLLKKIDVVVHLLAKNTIIGKNDSDFFEINSNFVQIFSKLAKENGVKKFILLSTIKVYGEETQYNKFFSVNSKPNPKDIYSKSKLEGEKKLISVANNSSMQYVIIRSPMVYGRNISGNLSNLSNFVKLGIPLPLKNINNLRSIVNIDNLLDFIKKCILENNASNNILLVSDDYDVSTTEIVKYLKKINNSKNILFSVNINFLVLLSHYSYFPFNLTKMFSSLRIDISETKRILKWKPKYDLYNSARKDKV